MKAKLSEHKHLITFLMAIAVACYQHLVEPIPGLEPEVWDALLGIGGTYSAVKAAKKMGFLPAVSLVKDANVLRKAVKEASDKDKERE